MDLHVGHGDVGGDGEVGKPQVLDVGLPERLLDQGVEAEASHHGGVGPGEVENHPPLLAHLETEVSGLNSHLGDVSLLRPQPTHARANADPRHPVNRDAGLQY